MFKKLLFLKKPLFINVILSKKKKILGAWSREALNLGQALNQGNLIFNLCMSLLKQYIKIKSWLILQIANLSD